MYAFSVTVRMMTKTIRTAGNVARMKEDEKFKQGSGRKYMREVPIKIHATFIIGLIYPCRWDQQFASKPINNPYRLTVLEGPIIMTGV